MGEEELNRWVPYLVQNLRDVIPRVAALLFDVIEDTRDETGQALTAAPGEVVAAVFGSGAGSGGGGGGGGPHVVGVQLLALLRVLCFWMVACTEHLQRHNGQDDAVAGYRFAEHEELLAYIACRCRVRVRRRFCVCWIEG